MQRDRRKIKNVIVNQRAQFRLAIPFLILIAFNAFVLIFTFWYVNRPLNATDSISQDQLLMTHAVQAVSSQSLTIGLYALFFNGVASILFWLVYSHRIFGPEVPILRQLDAMIDGGFDGRIKLRESDEMTDIADRINLLSDKLRDNERQGKI